MHTMHAPAFRVALLFIAGIFLGRSMPAGIGYWAAILIGPALAVIWLVRMNVPSRVTLPSLLGAIVCLAMGAAQSRIDRDRESVVPDSVLNGRSLVVGTVVDPPTTVGSKTRCTLEPERVRSRSGEFLMSDCMAVTLARRSNDSVQADLKYGMRVALLGEMSRPSNERNPGEFSIREYYEANGISYVLFVRGSAGVIVLDSSGGSWIMKHFVVPVRSFILSEIDRTVGAESGEFLKGLLIGERSGIPVTTRQAFVNAGVAHVLAVSGSNVAFVAAVFVFAVGFLRLPRIMTTICVAAGVVFYMMLTGNQPSVARATVMALVVLLGQVIQRRTNPYNALGISALIILGSDSRQLFDVGFQLSYGAVLSIVCLYPRMNLLISAIGADSRARRCVVWLLRLCAVSLSATLGTLPLTATTFGRVSVVGILANLLVIPATGLSVVLGCITCAAGALHPWAAWIWSGTNCIILQWTLRATEIAGGLPFAYIDTLTFRPVDSLPYFAILMAVFSMANGVMAKRLIILSLAALNVALFFPHQPYLVRHPGILRVSMIDVGEGDAILLECPGGESILLDAGPSTPSCDAGERYVVPYLKRRGISRIRMLLLTHPHGDHMGGAAFVLTHLNISSVAESGQSEPSGLYSAFLNAVTTTGASRRIVGTGDTLGIASGLRMYVLAPTLTSGGSDSSASRANLNNTSIVLRVVYGRISFLFAGDAEHEIERTMSARYGDFLRSTIIKAAHHGSSTSSTEEFVTLVDPECVLISVGKNNMFRHPSASVVKRYESHGVSVLRTDEDGAIMIETDGNTWNQVHWR